MRKPRRSAFLWLSLIVLFAGCSGGGGGAGAPGGGGDAGGGGGTPDYTMTVEPAGASGFQGSSVMVKASVARKAGFTGEVSVTIANPPAGVTAGTLTLPDNIVTGFLRIHLAPDIAAGGSLSLSVIGSNGTSKATVPLAVTVKPSEPSSQAKIEAAVSSGTLDYGTSLLYRAYAFYGDSRLPDAYRGSGSEKEDHSLRSEILDASAGLSPALQAALEPFTVRPADPKSWYNQTSAALAPIASLLSWKVQTPSGSLPRAAGDASGWKWVSERRAIPIRVWAQKNGDPNYDFVSSVAITEALNVFDKIYGPMTDDMAVRPIPDQEGGDDAIDVYIVDGASSVYRNGDNYAETDGTSTEFPDLPIGKTGSGFILINRSNLNASSFHMMLIHEFFHVLQDAHNQAFAVRKNPFSTGNVVYWFTEASARWASVHYDRILEPWNGGRGAYEEAHQFFRERFQNSKESLNSYFNNDHMYDAYIWAYFLEQKTGGPNIIWAIWKGLENASTFEGADVIVDSICNFQTNFRIFAFRNLNNEFLPGDPLPISERYISLDDQFLEDKFEPLYDGGTRALLGDSEQPYSATLEPLSANYLKFTVDDPTVKQVVFDLSGLAATAGLDVDALIKTKDKGWETVRNLNGKDKLKFCLDKPGEKLEDIRFILSNHQYKEGESVLAKFTAKSLTTPCDKVLQWVGTVTETFHEPPYLGNETRRSMEAKVILDWDETLQWYSLSGGTIKEVTVRTSTDPRQCSIITTTCEGPILPGDGAMTDSGGGPGAQWNAWATTYVTCTQDGCPVWEYITPLIQWWLWTDTIKPDGTIDYFFSNGVPTYLKTYAGHLDPKP